MVSGIILTILSGLFFLIGIFVLGKAKNKEKLSIFTISLAFVVMLGLLLGDLLPEIIETKNVLMVIPILFGFLILVFLDKLIPHHHHEHSEKHCDHVDHEEHLFHIGIITVIALAIHNMIEGLTLYTVTLNSVKSGLLMMLSVSLHNVPLGFQIGNSIEIKKKSLWWIILLCSSSFLGALIVIMVGNLNELVISILLSLTFGMLLYILIFELFNEIKSNLRKKEAIYGIILGIVILLITHFV